MKELNIIEKILFFDKNNLHEIKWEKYKEGLKIKDYFSNLIQNTESFITNIKTEIGFISLEDNLIPYSINNEEYQNSYVVSPYNHYITYAQEELKMLKNKPLELTLKFFLNTFSYISKRAKVNKVIYLNNWLLSTNLFFTLNEEQINELKKALCLKHPQHTICFRSINEGMHKEFKEKLEHHNFRPLPSRYIFFSNPDLLETTKKKARKNIKQDGRLLENENIEVINHEDITSNDYCRIKLLYDKLYLEKYSYQNPQFTKKYIEITHKTRTLVYKGIKINGVIEGIFASYIFDGKMANPILGYNTKLPKKTGLYRMLRFLALQKSIDENLIYHQSAGVGKFKSERGAYGYPEYTMIYVDHLPIHRKFFWISLTSILNKIALPLIKKSKL